MKLNNLLSRKDLQRKRHSCGLLIWTVKFVNEFVFCVLKTLNVSSPFEFPFNLRKDTQGKKDSPLVDQHWIQNYFCMATRNMFRVHLKHFTSLLLHPLKELSEYSHFSQLIVTTEWTNPARKAFCCFQACEIRLFECPEDKRKYNPLTCTHAGQGMSEGPGVTLVLAWCI